jgi:ribosomal protein S18 acetylase RimI-like enzyme
MPLFVAESDITYAADRRVSPAEVAELYRASGIRRPFDDLARIEKMLQHANLLVCARHAGTLVGMARALTDFSYFCYLSDLAVHRDYQRNGIGKELVGCIRRQLNDEVMILLLAAPEAMDYYPPLGFQKVGNGWIIPRNR